MKRYTIVKHVLVGFLILCGCEAKQDLQRESLVNKAIKSIDTCIHWAGEIGDQTQQRNKQIEEGIEQDCAEAVQSTNTAYEYVTEFPTLASKIIVLIDLGHYDVDKKRQAVICESAKSSFEESPANTAESYAYDAVCS